MKKLIHIATDEKFINSAYQQFNDVFPNQNIFYLLVDNPNDDLKYVKDNGNYIFIEKKLKVLEKLAKNEDLKGVICFHGLDFHKSFLLNKLPNESKIIWILWGAEIHNNPEIINQKKLYGHHTFKTFRKSMILKATTDILRHYYYKIKFKSIGPHKLCLKAIKRVNYCAILYKEEFKLIREKVKSDFRYLKFSYYPIEFMTNDVNTRIHSGNILLGNSASQTNNHLEVFKLLKGLPINDRKVVTPLSYGDQKYKEKIIKVGKKILDENFSPLVDYMPLHEYNEYLEQCGIVIMNHYRQQAVGNVLTMLWMGAKVYLDERNTLYHFLKRIGVYIYSIQQELHMDNQEVFSLLSTEKQEHNRFILKQEIGQNQLRTELLEKLTPILNES